MSEAIHTPVRNLKPSEPTRWAAGQRVLVRWDGAWQEAVVQWATPDWVHVTHGAWGHTLAADSTALWAVE